MQARPHFQIFVLAVYVVFLVNGEALGELLECQILILFLMQVKFAILLKKFDFIGGFEDLGHVQRMGQVREPVKADNF